MKDGFTTTYLWITIIFALEELFKTYIFFADTKYMFQIVIALSSLMLLFLILTGLYLVHALHKKLAKKYLVLPIVYLGFATVGFLFGTIITYIDIFTTGAITFVNRESIPYQLSFILMAIVSVFQIAYASYLIKFK